MSIKIKYEGKSDEKFLDKLGSNGGGGSGAAGVSSWNDLTDRPFYEEAPRVLVEEQTLTGFEMMDGGLFAVINPFDFVASRDEKYTIVWDGSEYECVAAWNNGSFCLGNLNYAMMRAEGDIPFALIHGDALYVVTEVGEEHTISITVSGNTIHHIDPKYIKDMYHEEDNSIKMIDDQTFSFVDQLFEGPTNGSMTEFGGWKSLTVIFDGVTYENVSHYVYNPTGMELGNTDEYPFSMEIWIEDGVVWAYVYTTVSGDSHTVSVIAVCDTIIHHIDHKYIKDMYYEKPPRVLVEEHTLTGFEFDGSSVYGTMAPFNFNIIPGETYVVTWDGVEYVCAGEVLNDGSVGLGNIDYGGIYGGGDIPFMVGQGDTMYVLTESPEDHIITIIEGKYATQTIDPKYIDGMYYEKPAGEYLVKDFRFTGMTYYGQTVIRMPGVYLEAGVVYTAMVDDQIFIGTAYESYSGVGFDVRLDDSDSSNRYSRLIMDTEDGGVKATLSVRNSSGTRVNLSLSIWAGDGTVLKQIDSKYIKDMYYEKFSGEHIVKDYHFDGAFENGSVTVVIPSVMLIDKEVYTATIDGHIYTSIALTWMDYVYFQQDINGKSIYIKTVSDGVELTYTDGSPDGEMREFNFSMWIGDGVELKQVDEKYIPDTIARVSDIPDIPDISIPDPTWESLPDKPFGDEPNWVSIVDNLELEFVQYTTPGPTGVPPYGGYFTGIQRTILNNTSHLRVTWDGEVYILPKYNAFYGSDAVGYCGNVSLYFYGDEGEGEVENMDDTTTPFFVYYMRGYNPTSLEFYTLDTSSSHTITVEYVDGYTAVHIDEKYIPDTIARVSDITAAITGAMEASY